MIVNDEFIYISFGVHYLDSERYLKMTCACKLLSVIFPPLLLVISHMFYSKIIMHTTPNIGCTHVITVFNFGFTTDFLNSYSLNFKHEAFHLVPYSRTIIDMLYLLKTQITKSNYIIGYTS